jgi:hypothetical protein
MAKNLTMQKLIRKKKPSCKMNLTANKLIGKDQKWWSITGLVYF